MGADRVNDFPVASNGHCFFCLNQIVALKPRPHLPSTRRRQINNSLQYLSRHVKMDLRKVFMDKEQVSPELLAKVKKARLKVELCEECHGLSERFSKVYRKLEKLEIELGSTLERILGKLESSDATEKLTGLINSSSADWNIPFEVLEALRAEAIFKSSLKLSRRPRVKIQNLFKKEVRAKPIKLEKIYKSTPTNSQLATRADFVSSHKIEASEFKVESLNDESLLENNDIGNYFSDNGDTNLDTVTIEEDAESGNQDNGKPNYVSEEADPNPDAARIEDDADPINEEIRSDANIDDSNVPEELTIEVKQAVSPSARAQNVSWADKYSINPETGNRKCHVCHMEFNSSSVFIYHYQTAHLKLRYKCVHCSKLFSVKGSLTLHQRTTGRCSGEKKSDPKFMCHLCAKSFSHKHVLQQHLDGVHFKILKYECNICEIKFMTKVALFTHRREVHRGMK